MSPSLPPTRGKSSEATRLALLAAARARFIRESYENVGLRDIAGDVGVDVALVSRYFGSKEDLFREVLRAGRKEEILPADLSAEEISAYMAQLFMQQGTENEHVERLLIILRSASSPAASQIVREALRKDVLEPFSERLGGRRPELRASTAMAIWMGMTIMRTVISVEPLCERESELAERLRQLFATALSDTAAPGTGIDASAGDEPTK
jgi:AcrR family transcriptional regulator